MLSSFYRDIDLNTAECPIMSRLTVLKEIVGSQIMSSRFCFHQNLVSGSRNNFFSTKLILGPSGFFLF